MSLSLLPPEIRQLPIPIRVQLADQLWESVIEDEAGFALKEAQKAELDRRLHTVETTPEIGSTWDAVKRRIMSRQCHGDSL